MESAEKEKSYKLTKTQAKFFWKRFSFWCCFWGCDKCWEIHPKEEVDDNCYASVGVSAKDGMAVIRLVLTWDVPVTNKLIDKVAFHESVHLFLSQVTDYDDNDIAQEHAVVRVMENQVWKNLSEYAKGN